MQEDKKLIICPNDIKIDILNNYNDSLHNIKFMSKKEFFDNYFFSYDYKAIYYLMKKYNYQLDVCKVYLNNLYVIDINKEYNDSKLNFLKDLKIELIENNLLSFNNNFKNYISKFKLEVFNYYDLDKYEEEAVSEEEADSFAKEINAKLFFVSANTGDGIDQMFYSLADNYFEDDFLKKVNALKKERMDSVFLSKEDMSSRKRKGHKGCC